MTEGAELPNKDKIRTLEEKETYKCLGILEANTVTYGDERKIQTEYLRRMGKLLETKLHSRNHFKGINTCVLPS